MRRHLSLQKQVPVPFKSRAATHRQAVNSGELSGAAAAETVALKRQIVDLQSQVSTLQSPPQPKTKTSYPESMNVTPKKYALDSPEVQITTLKRQIAELQSQIPTFGAQNHQITKKTYQRTAEQ